MKQAHWQTSFSLHIVVLNTKHNKKLTHILAPSHQSLQTQLFLQSARKQSYFNCIHVNIYLKRVRVCTHYHHHHTTKYPHPVRNHRMAPNHNFDIKCFVPKISPQIFRYRSALRMAKNTGRNRSILTYRHSQYHDLGLIMLITLKYHGNISYTRAKTNFGRVHGTIANNSR